ncbi:MAG: acyl-CoA thioesterase [Qingshengfaniella sp.]
MNTLTVQVTFGDCDPAGIVFYPNMFRWMDAAFHAVIQPFGGHDVLCSQLQAIGVGLVDASAQFHHPMRHGDTLEIAVTIEQWARRTLTLSYRGTVGQTHCFTGREVRCLFKRGETAMVAADLQPLRDILDKDP